MSVCLYMQVFLYASQVLGGCAHAYVSTYLYVQSSISTSLRVWLYTLKILEGYWHLYKYLFLLHVFPDGNPMPSLLARCQGCPRGPRVPKDALGCPGYQQAWGWGKLLRGDSTNPKDPVVFPWDILQPQGSVKTATYCNQDF